MITSGLLVHMLWQPHLVGEGEGVGLVLQLTDCDDLNTVTSGGLQGHSKLHDLFMYGVNSSSAFIRLFRAVLGLKTVSEY